MQHGATQCNMVQHGGHGQDRTGQDRTRQDRTGDRTGRDKLTFKLDCPDILWLAAFANLAMFTYIEYFIVCQQKQIINCAQSEVEPAGRVCQWQNPPPASYSLMTRPQKSRPPRPGLQNIDISSNDMECIAHR